MTCERFARIASNLRFAILIFFAPRSAIRKKEVQFGNPETIRENQAIRANLRIYSRESGRLSSQNVFFVSSNPKKTMEGFGDVRWPIGPHLTLNLPNPNPTPPPKKQKTNRNKGHLI